MPTLPPDTEPVIDVDGLVSPRWYEFLTRPRSGLIIQTVRSDDGSQMGGTTTIPFDNTTPQSNEGDQYLQQAITPYSASSWLWVRALVHFANNGGQAIAMALFQDAGANALKTVMANPGGANFRFQLMLDYWVLAGSVAATTFKIRAGAAVASTTTVNGSNSAAAFNLTLNSFLEIREVSP